nr:reverse transcriptase domain-containing protein [Tanacetum cinerariifolium]
MKQNGVSDDALRLSLFPYSLTHHATTWYDRLLRNSIHSFDDMMRKFLSEYFFPSMVTKLRNEITNLKQDLNESLFEAWDHYKLSIDRCPNHNMILVTQIDTFYNGLTLRHQDTINAPAGGTFMKKRPKECYDLIKNMTAHHNHWDTLATRDETYRTISSITTIESPEVVRQLEMMNKNFQDMPRQIQSVKYVNMKCETYGGPYYFTECPAVGGYTQEAAYATTDLTPTRITLELATRSIAYPAGIAEDVFVQVGKFTFLADFVVIDYDVNPRVPLILGRPFLWTARALVDAYGEELILRNGDEKLIFHANSTSKHLHKRGNDTTLLSDSFPSLTHFETSDSLLEEFADELTLFDSFPLGNEDFDLEADLKKTEYLLNQDPSTESNIEIIDPIFKKFPDEPALDYSPLPRDDNIDDDDDDDLFDLKSDNDEWKKLLYGEFYKVIDSKNDKNNDSKMKLLIFEAHIVDLNVLLTLLLTSDSTLPEELSESSKIASLSSFPFRKEGKGGGNNNNKSKTDKCLLDHGRLAYRCGSFQKGRGSPGKVKTPGPW